MTATANPDEFQAEIPAQPLDTTVGYYIEAEDTLGNSDTAPAAAPGAVYTFDVAEDSGWLLAQAQSSTVGAGGTKSVVVMSHLGWFLLPAAMALVWRKRIRSR